MVALPPGAGKGCTEKATSIWALKKQGFYLKSVQRKVVQDKLEEGMHAKQVE